MRTPTPFAAPLLIPALAVTLAGTTLAPQAALAQAPAAHPMQTTSFRIAAGPLGMALHEFAQAAGIYIGTSGSLTEGRSSPGLQGHYAIEQGLAVLLAETGLEARRTGPGRYVLSPRTDVGALAPITVTGGLETNDPAQTFIVTTGATASKTDTPLQETPRSVSVVTRAQLDARGAMSLPEAVQYTAGVTTNNAGFDPRFDQISIRGFSVNTKGDYLDGLRQTPGIYATPRTETYLLEQIDVIKGPMSVLYGQGTPGGLVNRVSKQTSAAPLRELMVAGATHDRRQLAFDVADAINEAGTARFRLTGLTRRGEHERRIADERDVLAPVVDLQLGERTTLRLRGQYIKDETDAGVGTYVDNGRPTSQRISDPDYDHQRQTEYQLGYALTHQVNDALTLSQRLRHADLDMDVRYLDNAGLRPGTRILDRSAWSVASQVESLVMDNQALLRLDTAGVGHRLLAGFDYQWVNWDNRIGYQANGIPALDLDDPQYGGLGLDTPPHNYVSVRQRDTQYGFYLSEQASAGPWRFNVGGRYDIAHQRNQNVLAGAAPTRKRDEAFTWQAGALYLTDSGVAPYVSYATSFTPNTSLDAAGTPLDPTRGAQIEAGVKYQPDGMRSQVTLAAYQIEEKDAVRAVPGTPYSERAGMLRSRGVELEMLAELDEGLDLIAYYSYNRVRVMRSNDPAEVGKTPSRQPRHTAGLWLDYRLPQGPLAGLGLGAGARYVGSSYGDTPNTLRNPAATLIDLALSYEPGRRHAALRGWLATLSVQNVADKEVPVCNGGYCYLGPGRQILGSVRYRW